jgi:hypothetical protein
MFMVMSVPINYIIYDKREGQTKNDYFREMVREIREWGVKPRIVTGDTAVLKKVRYALCPMPYALCPMPYAL